MGRNFNVDQKSTLFFFYSKPLARSYFGKKSTLITLCRNKLFTVIETNIDLNFVTKSQFMFLLREMV